MFLWLWLQAFTFSPLYIFGPTTSSFPNRDWALVSVNIFGKMTILPDYRCTQVELSLKIVLLLQTNFCCSKSCSWYSWTYLSSTLVSHWMNFSSASSLNLIGKTYTFWAILSMNVMKYSLHLETFQASVHIWRCGLTIGGLVPCYNKSSVAPVFSSHIDNTARNQIRCVGDLRCS